MLIQSLEHTVSDQIGTTTKQCVIEHSFAKHLSTSFRTTTFSVNTRSILTSNDSTTTGRDKRLFV